MDLTVIGDPGQWPFWAAAGAGGAITLGIVQGRLRRFLAGIGYGYLNGRVSAIGNPCVDREFLEALSASRSVREVRQALHGDEFPIEGGDPWGSRVVAARSVLAHVPKGARPFYEWFLLLEEQREVRRLLAAALLGTGERPRPVGRLTAELADRVSAVDPAAALTELSVALGWPELPPVADALPAEAEGLTTDGRREGVERVERALDAALLGALRSRVSRRRGFPGLAMREFAGLYADYRLAALGLRARASGADPQVLASGFGDPLGRLTVDSVVQIAQGRPMELGTDRRWLQEAIAAGTERALDRAFLDEVAAFSLRHFNHVGPSVRYVVSRWFEARNLEAVLRVVEGRMTKEVARGLWVCEGDPLDLEGAAAEPPGAEVGQVAEGAVA